MMMKFYGIFLVSSLILGCGGSSNEQSTGNETNETTNENNTVSLPIDVAPIKNGNWYQPAPFVTWQWQLLGTVNKNYNVELYDIDLFDSSQALILELQSTGKKVICYFSAGSYESWRADASEFTRQDYGNALAGWEEEKWLDIRSNNVQRIMKKRLDLASEKGCDGVEPDNMDGYENNSGLNLTANEQLAYNRFIANEAHQRQLSVALKNDLAQITQLVNYYDFAINEQCFEFAECEMLTPFINQNKAVLNSEYKSSYINDKSTVCSRSLELKFSTLMLPLNLDDEFRISCL
jgi:hypothetical protein